jgi:DNA replication protein DnaC
MSVTSVVLTPEMLERINANRLAAIERRRLREQAEKELMRPEQEREIKSYLNSSNRPFSANNLIDEFASKFKKSRIVKALQVLVAYHCIN